MQDDANSVANAGENANANSHEVNKGTQENDNSKNDNSGQNSGPEIDYKKKFSESSSEAQRLFKENEDLKEALRLKEEGGNNGNDDTNRATEDYPGFEDLDEEGKRNIIIFSEAITKRAKEQIWQDPAIAFARKQYNENAWDSAFNKVLVTYPELAQTKDEFKAKYFNVNNVPENIEAILTDVAKIHLFDKAKEIGAKEADDLSKRDDLERNNGGPKETQTRRTLEDWQRMAASDPAKFASLSKEYQEDLTAGRI